MMCPQTSAIQRCASSLMRCFRTKQSMKTSGLDLRMHKVPEDEQKRRIEEAMALVNLTGLGARKPYELSGGQQQRVALARAIVVQPDILLFDEPLSNLDAKLREKVRVEIREIQQKLGITAVYVTHDQAEALAISDVIIWMNHGEIQQIASPREIYDNPHKRFVADFIGIANHLKGTISSRTQEGAVLESGFLYAVFGGCQDGVEGPEVDICWRPEDMMLLEDGQDAGEDNVISGIVDHSVYMGNMLDIFFRHDEKMYRANVSKDHDIQPGTAIRFAVSRAKLHVMEVEQA